MRLALVLALFAGCGPSGRLYLAGRDPGTLTRVDARQRHGHDAHGPRAAQRRRPAVLPRLHGRPAGHLRARAHVVVRAGRQRPGEPRRGLVLRAERHAWARLEHPARAGHQRDVPRRARGHGGRARHPQHRGRVPGWPMGATPGIVVQRAAWRCGTRPPRRSCGAAGHVPRRLPRRPGRLLQRPLPDALPRRPRGPRSVRAVSPGAFSPDGSLLAVPATRRAPGHRRRGRGARSRSSPAHGATRLRAARVGVERVALLQRGRRRGSARGGPASPHACSA